MARENEQLREELAMAYGELRNSVSEITNRTSRIECLKDEGMELKESKAKLEGVLLEEEKKRKRLENEIIALRKELEQYRGKEEIKESQMPTGIARNTVGAMGKSTSDLTVKLESLRQERRKDIEKFKM